MLKKTIVDIKSVSEGVEKISLQVKTGFTILPKIPSEPTIMVPTGSQYNPTRTIFRVGKN